ncbi:MAG: PQQ-binding-like beta-propeller repeat protein [Haloarculaceae archaeon]
MRRRTFLATTATGLAALAGCLDGGTDGTDGTTTGDRPRAGSARTTTNRPGRTATRSGASRSPETSPTPGPGPETSATPGSDTGRGTLTDPSPVGDPDEPASVESAWPAPAHDAGFTHGVPGVSGPSAAVAELWAVEAGAPVSTPVLTDGTLYVGAGDGTVLALEARNGTERWRRSVGGAAGAPWVRDGRVYVPTGEAIAVLSTGDGSEQFRVETPERADDVSSSGALVRAAVLVAPHGLYWVANEDGPTLVATPVEGGTEQWRTSLGDAWDLPVFASEDTVYVSSGTRDSRFWQFDPETGEVLAPEPRYGADFPAEECYADGTVYAVEPFFGSVRATPVTEGGDGWSTGVPAGCEAGGGRLSAGDARVYYVSNADDGPGLTALAKTDGSKAWTAEVNGIVIGRPVVSGAGVIVPTDSALRCFDRTDGTEVWTRERSVGNRLVVADNLVYAVGDGAVRALRPP